MLTNGSITAGGDVSITTGSLMASNLMLQAGRSLTLQVTNLLTDIGVANGNIWFVGGGSLVGLNLPAAQQPDQPVICWARPFTARRRRRTSRSSTLGRDGIVECFRDRLYQQCGRWPADFGRAGGQQRVQIQRRR